MRAPAPPSAISLPGSILSVSLAVLVILLAAAGCTSLEIPSPGGQSRGAPSFGQNPNVSLTGTPHSTRFPSLPTPAPTQIAFPSLAGTGWALISYRDAGGLTPVKTTVTAPTLQFSRDGLATGRSGCNWYSAPYEESGNRITIGQVAATLMACPDPGVMAQEEVFLGLLGLAGLADVSGGHLTLYDANGTALLVFARAGEPSSGSLSLEGTDWRIDVIHTGGTSTSVIEGTHPTLVFGRGGNLTGNTGCNQIFSTYAQDGAALVPGNITSTKMNCRGAGVMIQEMQILQSLAGVAGFRRDAGGITLVDREGRPLLSLVPDRQENSSIMAGKA